MIINHNLNAMNAHRQLGVNTLNAGKSMEKLSSGLRINRAGDDAAGLAISEKMRGQIRGLDQASRNAQDGISLIQTAEGALNETHSILQRMRELAVQAANGTNQTEDLSAIQEELDSLKTEITRIGEATEFNGKKLLNGDLGVSVTAGANMTAANGFSGVTVNGTNAGTYTINVGDLDSDGDDLDITITDSLGNSQTIVDISDPATGQTKKVNFDSFGIVLELNDQFNSNGTNANGNNISVTGSGVDIQIGSNNSSEQRLNISISDMTATALGIGGSTANPTWSINDVDVTSNANARESIDVIEKAIGEVSTQRSQLGAYQNRLEHTINNLNTSSENLSAAESRIRDVDMAKEMMNFSKNNILAQAAQAMLAQANQQPQGVLQLLR